MGERLNIGAGNRPLAGYTNLEIKDGNPGYPLNDHEDGSVVEVRAAHVLEHYPYEQTVTVLQEWARVLEPGGVLKVAVPDFDKIVEAYEGGEDAPIEGWIMGGHVDRYDMHGAIFNREKLKAALQAAGLVDIQAWEPEPDTDDCAALPVSLNLQGRKPREGEEPETETLVVPDMDVVAAMSVPRLGFMDHFYCCFRALLPLNINLRKYTGAFWGQCIERCLMQILEEDRPDAILCMDYDSIFRRDDVVALMRLLAEHPEADAVAALQLHQSEQRPLFTLEDQQWDREVKVDRAVFDDDLTQVRTAHFGLTLLRAEALRKMPHPWFWAQPDDEGTWGDTRTDADIWFWRQWEKHGNTLYSANRVPIGHAQLLVRWPDINMEPLYQTPSDFYVDGPPEGLWE